LPFLESMRIVLGFEVASNSLGGIGAALSCIDVLCSWTGSAHCRDHLVCVYEEDCV
jgi:hypothetical protein